jgi:hypothetical protein
MTPATRRRRVSWALIFACLAASGASCVLDGSSGSRGGETGSEEAGVVITVDQRPTFLAYAKKLQMSDLSLESVSVGDVLQDSGVKYYDIPLWRPILSLRHHRGRGRDR